MLDLDFIRQNPDLVKEGTRKKQRDPSMVDKVLELDQRRRELIQDRDDRRRRKKLREKEIGADPENKKSLDLKAMMREERGEIKDIESELKKIETQLEEKLFKIPNLPASDIPEGKDESENVVLRRWGTPKKFDFKPLDHVELGEALDVIDIDRATKVSGTRFGYLKREAALLEFALVQYAFNTLVNEKTLRIIANEFEKGYSAKPFIPIVPPVMIKPEVYTRMARLDPGQEEERYYIPKDDIYLVGSAEHTLGPLHMDEIIPEKDLPIRYVGFSTAFRREAGSYGKDTRGILRVHQFDKVEMESFTVPENSVKEQEFIVAIQEYLMQGLGIPYQVVLVCTGDMGGPNYRQVDIETWLPGQGKYRETHSSDLMTDYQSRRLKTRVRREDGQVELVHMNDATAFAIGRTIIAILENNQQEDGSVRVPKVLQEFVGKEVITS